MGIYLLHNVFFVRMGDGEWGFMGRTMCFFVKKSNNSSSLTPNS